MSPQNPIRLVILDERPIVRAGLVACLERREELAIVAVASTAADLARPRPSEAGDVALVGHPRRDGLKEAIATMSALHPACRFVVLSDCGGDARARRAIAAGVHGFLLQTSGVEDLVDAIHAASRGQRYLDSLTALDMARRDGEEDLRAKEVEVLCHVAAGKANKQIAAELATTEGTVKNHIKRIMAKLAAADRTHAVVIAARRGYISVGR